MSRSSGIASAVRPPPRRSSPPSRASPARRCELIEIDRPRGGLHLVDRIVHRADQRGDRAAVERRQEGPPDGGQDLADDVVGLVLPAVDLADIFLVRGAAVDELGQRFGGRDERRRMRFEHPEEIARPWKDTLEPVEHLIPCVRAARLVEREGGGNRRSAGVGR